jgi:hypothetical protein
LKLDSIKIDKSSIGELFNQTYSEIELEIQAKAFELESENEEAEQVTEWPDDIAVIAAKTTTFDEKSETDEVISSEYEQEIPEGHYAVIVDGKIVSMEESVSAVREFISSLLLNDNLDLDNIQLLKRIKIDFGVYIGE